MNRERKLILLAVVTVFMLAAPAFSAAIPMVASEPSATNVRTFTISYSFGVLTDGVPSTSSLSGTGDTEMWSIMVGDDCLSMHAVLTCGSADFDLYGRLGAEPTTSTYDWRGYTYGGEDVTYNNPGDGTWFIMVRSYSGSGSYTLTVTLTYSSGDDNELDSGVPVTSSLPARYATEMWYIEVGANCESMEAILTCGSADFDLYGRLGAEPTTGTYDWRGYTSGGEEVTYANPGAGTWYIMVRSYSGTGAYTLTVTLTYSGGDTTPPSVTINDPSNGETVSGTTTISFSASDANGISSRRILIDGTQVSTASSYSWDTTGYANGAHTIRCEATDPSGNTGYSQISVSVDNTVEDNELQDGVTVTSSLAAQYDTEMWYIVVDANCESMHAVLTCGSADFDLYGRLGAEPTTSTYNWRGYTSGGEDVTYSNPGAGVWYIMVRSYSGTGSYALTVSLTYSGPDTTAPSVSITSPSNGATVSGTTSISFTATDANGISSRRILVDGTQVSTSSSYSWVTTGYADGSTHTIRCEATDPSGNTGYSQISVTVDNSAPAGEKIGVFFWASDAGTQTVINEYRAILVNEGYTKFFEFKDTSNFYSDFSQVAAYEDENDIIFFYLFGHGNNDGSHSLTAFAPDSSIVWSNEFRSYCDELDSNKVGMFISSCDSGDWADDMAGGGYLAISSSDEDHYSWAVSTLPGEEVFANYFWYYVSLGYNAVEAFNLADAQMPTTGTYVQNPKLVDECSYVFFG